MDIAFTFNVIRINKIFYIIKAFANKGLEIINNNIIFIKYILYSYCFKKLIYIIINNIIIYILLIY